SSSVDSCVNGPIGNPVDTYYFNLFGEVISSGFGVRTNVFGIPLPQNGTNDFGACELEHGDNPGSPFPPATPALFTASGGYSSISMGWDVAARADGYQIWRSSDGTNYSQQLSTINTSTTDQPVVNNFGYYYKVRAANVYGLSAFSSIIQTNALPYPSSPIVRRSSRR